MQEKISHILNPDIPLRKRMFQLLSVIALSEFIIVTIYTILSGGGIGHILIMLAGTALFASTVAISSKSQNIRFGSAVTGLLYFFLYPLTFFSSGGMYGGAPVVFAFALVYVFLITENRERILCLSLCIIITIACFVLSCRYPGLLVRRTMETEHLESLLSIFLVTLLLCTLFAFVTQVYQTENSIVQKQKKEIESLNQSQKRFFSSMSHEIRTPVNAILGFNEMTLREQISGEVRENSQNIEVAGKILLHTVNEILDMSRLETGNMEILKNGYRTTAMLSDIVNMIRLQAQEKGLAFRISADPRLPSVVRGDEVRIRQVLLNVLTNAVKYTKTGSVCLSVGFRCEEDGSFRIIYEVADTGIGIREENIPSLFTAFQRADMHETHAIEGTGLGLAIVKQLLDLMNGTVSVTSTYGKGTTFHIEVPQEITDASPIGEVHFHQSRQEKTMQYESAAALPSLRILAVDDTPMNLMVVKKLLRSTGAEVDTAASGTEALQKAKESHYDVILMDHQMPEIDGIECLHRIREQEEGQCRASKVICLTANVGPEMEKLYFQEGFDGYLMKPVRGKTLEEELHRILEE